MFKTICCLLFFCTLFCGTPASAEVKYTMDEVEKGGITLLVNLTYRLSYDYEPSGLVVPNVPRPENKTEKKVNLLPEAATALEKLFQEAAASGYTLYAVSGYRDYYEQKRLYADRVEAIGERRAKKTVAYQGASEHQLGLAMDINGESTLKKGLTNDFGDSPEGAWITQNAYRFGFIVRYPEDKTDVTGFSWEPWHIRYVGKEAAADIYTLGITLEEYCELIQSNQK